MATSINRLRPWEECSSRHGTEKKRSSSEATRLSPPVEEKTSVKQWYAEPPSHSIVMGCSSPSSPRGPHELAVAAGPSAWRLASHPPADQRPRLQENWMPRFLGPKGPREVMNEPSEESAARSICPRRTPRRGCSGPDKAATSPVSPVGDYESAQSLMPSRVGEAAIGLHSDVRRPEGLGSPRFHESSRAHQQPHEVGRGLRQLEVELQRVLDGPTQCESTSLVEGEAATNRYALDWTLDNIRHGLHMVRAMVHTMDTSTGAPVPGRFDPAQARHPRGIRRPCPLSMGALQTRLDEGEGRSFSTEESTLDMETARSPTARFLPPPTPVSVFSGPHAHLPTSPSSPAFRTAPPTHLQDLQHQVSKKTLALQTLGKEHERLLSAYSRSQTRCAVLERKSCVADSELDNVMEEAMDLRFRLEMAETQVTKLEMQLNAAQSEKSEMRDQYGKIVAGASELQATYVERWMKERAAMIATQEKLQGRIVELECQIGEASKIITFDGGIAAAVGEDDMTTSNAPPFISNHDIDDESISSPSSSILETASSNIDETGETLENDDVLHSTSFQDLRSEILRLRKACRDKDLVLQEVASMSRQVERKAQTARMQLARERKRKRGVNDDDGRQGKTRDKDDHQDYQGGGRAAGFDGGRDNNHDEGDGGD
ncbi:MAG: suppressor of los1-1 [Watsoniomyces obsoletus]|nr:MAG: suppressor of los1-1 [Watsoniomyces obsoletus]